MPGHIIGIWESIFKRVLPAELEFRVYDEEIFPSDASFEEMDRYGSLRLAEREIVRMRPHLCLNQNLEICNLLQGLITKIRNPRDSLSAGGVSAREVWAEVDRLKLFCADFTSQAKQLLGEPLATFIPFHLIDYPPQADDPLANRRSIARASAVCDEPSGSAEDYNPYDSRPRFASAPLA